MFEEMSVCAWGFCAHACVCVRLFFLFFCEPLLVFPVCLRMSSSLYLRLCVHVFLSVCKCVFVCVGGSERRRPRRKYLMKISIFEVKTNTSSSPMHVCIYVCMFDA